MDEPHTYISDSLSSTSQNKQFWSKKNDNSNWLDLSNIELMNSEKQLKPYCRVLKLISNVSSKWMNLCVLKI